MALVRNEGEPARRAPCGRSFRRPNLAAPGTGLYLGYEGECQS